MTDHVMNTYARLPVSFVRGEGVYLFDSDGRQYIDAISGIGVCSLGHAHPEIAEVIAEQAASLLHSANLAHVPEQERLADRLTELSGMERTFFCNSGAEANECAIKIARVVGHQRDLSEPQIIVAENSFHGRTLACLSASDSRKIQEGFEPLVGGFLRVPFNDISAIEQIAARQNQVVAILLEPIQGEGGVNIPAPGYLAQLRALCDRHGWLLMFDEVQTGIAKTGRWFAWQLEDARPDVMALAKALGNGVPIGACVSRGEAADALKVGKHGSTYGGGPLVCRTANKVLEIIQRDGLLEHTRSVGQQLLQQLNASLQDHPNVKQIRGQGLMIGVSLNQPIEGLVGRALEEKGVLLNVTRERVIRLLPPLIISEVQAMEIATAVTDLVTAS